MAEDSEIENGAEDDPWADALAEQAEAEAKAASGDGVITDADAGLSELIAEVAESEGVNKENVELDMILEIPVTISMEIGRTQISIRNLLKLNQGSVVELDRLAGEPLDVLVNGTLIAHGEVVVVNEKFGIRLTDVITAMERVKKLQ